MVARYRSGDGTGIANVNPYESCSQDSNFAVYAAIKEIESFIQQNSERKRKHLFFHEEVVPFVNPGVDEGMFERFEGLVERYEHKIIREARYRVDWRRNLKTLMFNTPIDPEDRYDVNIWGVRSFTRALLSRGILVPRWNFDAISKMMLKRGATARLVRTNFLGANDPELVPGGLMIDRSVTRADFMGRMSMRQNVVQLEPPDRAFTANGCSAPDQLDQLATPSSSPTATQKNVLVNTPTEPATEHPRVDMEDRHEHWSRLAPQCEAAQYTRS
ncbi:hypothetical protein HK102_006768 [Quaeritorhiza haematococci]|nr:hypothetical protein HK102_006768 [Quaeritorhiza haematococci]